MCAAGGVERALERAQAPVFTVHSVLKLHMYVIERINSAG